MEKEFVLYFIAKKLKELGFNEPCIGWFTETGMLKIFDYQINVSSYIKAPLWQQAIDWLKKKGVKIVENPQFGWDVYVMYNEEWILAQGGQLVNIEDAVVKAIEEIKTRF